MTSQGLRTKMAYSSGYNKMFQKENKIKCFQMVQNHVVGAIGKCFSARTIVLIIPQGYSAMIYTIYTIDQLFF